MIMARKDAEALIYNLLEDLTMSTHNTEIYKQKIASMSDKKFNEYVDDLLAEKDGAKLFIYMDNYGEGDLNIENNKKVAKKYKIPLFSKISTIPEDGSPGFKSTIDYMVIDMPVRRPAQVIAGQMNVHKDTRRRDKITGQVTGASRGGGRSVPESDILSSMGYDKGLLEEMKFRGGDIGAENAMNRSIEKFGVANMEQLLPYSTGVKSKQYLKALLLTQYVETDL